MPHRVYTQHEAREVEFPLAETRDVRTVDVAEFALEALRHHLILLCRRQASGVLVLVLVDHVEQRRERRTELEAQATAVTEIEHSGHFVADVFLVRVLRVVGVVRDGHRTSIRG